MMIGPKTYIKEFETKSYEELLEEKKKLNKKIDEFENKRIELSGIIISPSPEVVYQCNLEYLSELCNLIAKKYREKKLQEAQNEFKIKIDDKTSKANESVVETNTDQELKN